MAKQAVELDQAQAAAAPPAARLAPEPQNQIGPPRVNTGLAGQAPEDFTTPPGRNLDITV